MRLSVRRALARSLPCLALAAACGGEPAPDLASSSSALTATPAGVVLLDAPRYRAPGTLRITVADSNRNTRSDTAEQVQVTVTSTTSTYGEKVSLRENGLDTGIFEGSIPLKIGSQVYRNGVLEVRNKDVVTVTYQDPNDGTGHSVTVKATAVIDTTSPDLTVTAVAGPSAARAGDVVTLTDTVANDPLGGAAPATQLTYFLSRNAVAGDADDVAVATRAVPALAAGASSAGSASFTVPAGLSGTYYLVAAVDPANGIAEFSETNDARVGATLTITPPVPAADLSFASLAGPATASAGQAITVQDVIANAAGAATAPSVRVEYYLSSDATLGAGDLFLGSRYTGLLAGGATEAGAVTVTVPAGVSGTFYLLAMVDADQRVAESNEANNVGVGGQISIGPPDLTVAALSVPAASGSGATITVSDQIANVGPGSAPPVRVDYYASADGLLGAGALFMGSRFTGALAPGAVDAGTTALALPTSLTTVAYVIAVADADGRCVELDETNNVRASAPIALSAPDLQVASVTAPAALVPGATVTASDVVVNAGGGTADAVIVEYYLTPNPVVGDGNDVLVGRRWTAALAAGGADAGSVTFTVPALAPGTWYLVALVDATGRVAESNELNNATASGPIALSP